MFNKLSSQIGLVFFLGTGFVLGVFSWVIYQEESDKLPLFPETEASETTELIASSISNDVLFEKSFQMWKKMDRIKKRNKGDKVIAMREFAIINTKQQLLTHSDPSTHPVMNIMPLPAEGTYWHSYNLQVVQPIYHPSGQRIIGKIAISFDASSIQEKLAELQRHILLIYLLAMFVSILIAAGISLRVGSPLRQLANLSAEMGSGKIDISKFKRTAQEINGLAMALHAADKRIEEKSQALAQSDALLKSILNNSPTNIFIKDLKGAYLLVNSQFETLYHINNEEAAGKTDGKLFDTELANALSMNDKQVLGDIETIAFEQTIPDDRGYRDCYSLKFPLYDTTGDVYAICCISTDITQQKRTSAQMKKLSSAMEQADEMIIITDEQGVIEYVNPAFERISGYSSKESLGKKPNIVKSGQHTDNFYSAIWDVLNSGQSWVGDFINKNKDGRIYEVSQSIAPIKNSNGEIIGFSSVQRDVTHDRALQHKLQHTDRVESLGILAGGIAHDFNNLLTAILGNASLAQTKIGADSTAHKYLKLIEKASYSAADLCKQMLAYSGKGKFVVKTINLSDMVDEMTKLIEVSLEKNVVIKYNLNEQLPPIDADLAQMQQIILNLITNASEAIEGKSGVISLSTGVTQADSEYLTGCMGDEQLKPGRYIYLEVSDTGCGMTAETQKKIFDPFFTTKFTGRGLGMSAMLGIVKGHHGGLRIYSEHGQGTTIKIIFPMSHGIKDDIRKSAPAEPFGKINGIALVIDDEESVREIACSILEAIGFKVISACDGRQGVDLFQQHKDNISVVLLDMTMPKMDGVACFSELRQIKPDVKVVLSSGYNEQDATSRFTGKGLAGFIQKPYAPSLLVEVLEKILNTGAPNTQ